MKKQLIVLLVLCLCCASALAADLTTNGGVELDLSALPHQDEAAPAAVYFISDISPESLIKAYQALGVQLPGKVGVKLSTGESERTNYLRPALIGDLVQMLNGTIVECNTAYGGSRASTAMHMQLAKDHGFTDIAEVDILDAEDSMELPIEGGNVLSVDYVGSHFANYDSFLVLSHFKGHAMAGFGGAIKNISIGFGSSMGKVWIHSGGTKTSGGIWGEQDPFLEAMADAAKGVDAYMGDNIAYISVLNRLSVDCDCDGNPSEPDMHDIGILASTDPLAIDQAAIDLVYAMPGSASLIERIESRNGLHTLDAAEAVGLGSRNYNLVVWMIEWLRREAIYLWYYLDIQVRQIAPYWALGILLGSAVSVFGKRYIHGAFARIGQRKMGWLGVIPASLLGVASPLCMYGTIPIAASFSEQGVKDDCLAAFMMSSILLNPQLIFYSGALGRTAVVIRCISCTLCGCVSGWLIRLFYSGRGKSFFDFTGFHEGANRDTDPNLLMRFLKNVWRNVKATGPMFALGILLTALYQIHVPGDFVSGLFGKNEGFGVLMAATIGVPLYMCGGGTIPLLQQWLVDGMSMGSAAAFMITGPATKITNLGAMKIVLGWKRFILYILFTMAFAWGTGMIVDLLI